MRFTIDRALALALSPFIFSLSTFSQRPPAQPNAAEILHKMQKLQVLGSVLYIVAHPDDENTRLIAWLANGKKVRTGNLSLTRGDGGQNLIGPELGDALGIIRTQELLEARRIDGGEQFFTRAVDFGYSKNAAESFEKWGKQEVLSDVVRVIRMFRPDVIITRFAPDRSAGHGHHEASAILAEEAFDLAGDPNAFPEQLQKGLEVWQPRRLFFNGSTWWKKDLADIAKNDPDWFSVDVGGYDPLLGLSYTEIAGRSRSMHKSQGFGAAETRGEMIEYLKLVKGDKPKNGDIFEGIDMTWGRIQDGSNYQRKYLRLLERFDPAEPSASSDALLALREQMSFDTKAQKKTSDFWAYDRLQDQLGSLALDCIGLSVEQVYASPTVVENEFGQYEVVLTNRSNRSLQTGLWGPDTVPPFSTRRCSACSLGSGLQYEPFWLEKPHSNLQDIAPNEIGWPGLTSKAWITVRIAGQGQSVEVNFPGIHKWVDRVDGERIRPVYVTPVASVEPRETHQFNGGDVVVEVRAMKDNLTGMLEADVQGCYSYEPRSFDIGTMKRDERKTFTFRFTGNDQASVGVMKLKLTSGDQVCTKTLHEIDYPHIMPQVYYTPAEVKLVPLEVSTTAKRVGYVKGAGDEVPQALEQLGVVVEFIDASTGSAGHLSLEELKKYDAIVTGIRAYNATKGMKELHPLLLQYVEQGGTLIVQYNTMPRFSVSGVEDFQIDPSTLGPHPFKITRDRVTVEEAPPTFLDPKHPLLTTPNAITAKDFEGWVQERGLYFAGDLGDKYTPLIAWNDPGEEALNGGLITCDHGQGRFIYTGISFFRQLPAGVPGAYRLFANLISKRAN